MTPRERDISFKKALSAFQSGASDAAEAECKAILVRHPRHSTAVHLLGLIARQQGKSDRAMDLLVRAIRLEPSNPTFYNTLGNLHKDRGDLERAADNYRKAIHLNPKSPILRYNLGLVYQDKGDLPGAVREYAIALRFQKDFPEALLSLANGLRALGRGREACVYYERALECRPEWPEAHQEYAFCLRKIGRVSDAAEHYRACLQLRPDCLEAHNNLGNLCMEEGRVDEAIGHYAEAIRLDPLRAEVHHHLGTALVLKWRVREGVRKFREALKINPALPYAHSNLLFNLHYDCADRVEELFREHGEWNRQHAEPLTGSIKPHRNKKTSHRRLRIGYVSRDFRDHPVSTFIAPLLFFHDRSQFEVFCYADEAKSDSVTTRCREAADGWVNVTDLGDEDMAERIREDRIDILVDLAGHTTAHRLLVFARKPSPVQFTYLGYPNTTGIRTVDYRITDAHADPPGAADPYYTESLVRLPHGFLCYQPPRQSPPVGDLPAWNAGRVTFGSFNNLCKITPEVIDLWARLLRFVPHSTLKLKSFLLGDEDTRVRIQALFEERGIPGERVHVMRPVQSHEEHLALYHDIDIALDPFPYNGTTTTCEALWMGVPVVVVAGQSHASRVGVSLLNHAGLKEFIANDSDAYVRIASTMAEDPTGLRRLRRSLRQRLSASHLLGKDLFVASVEEAFHRSWDRWCRGERTLGRGARDPRASGETGKIVTV